MQTTLALTVTAFITVAHAGDLLDKLNAGEPIRVGFANEVPWAYPGEDNEPLGFVNEHAIAVLKKMGAVEIKPVVTDWGGLIPGLRANRFDVITGGLYILKSRCRHVNFSEPIAVIGDAFLVPKGNPNGIQTYTDIKEANGILVTGAGYNIVETARKQGIADRNIMQVPGPTEILLAVKAGRAIAGGANYFTALRLAKESGGSVEVTDPGKLPKWTRSWVGIAFRPQDKDFVTSFNAKQKSYLGSDEMLQAAAAYGYTTANLPGDVTTNWVCKNRSGPDG